jgi:hypothetical protein
VTIDNPCAERLQSAFLDNPSDRLDTSCVSQTPGPSFILPEDLYIAPGLAGSVYDIDLGVPRGTAWIETLAVISLLGLATLLFVLLVIGLVWLVRWRKRGAARLDKSAVVAYLLALVVIVAFLTMPALVTRVNNEYLGRTMILYSLGPSRDFGPAVLLAWLMPLAGLATLALGAITLWAWLVRRWSPGFRLVTTLVVLSSLTMVMLGVRWGLFIMLL